MSKQERNNDIMKLYAVVFMRYIAKIAVFYPNAPLQLVVELSSRCSTILGFFNQSLLGSHKKGWEVVSRGSADIPLWKDIA